MDDGSSGTPQQSRPDLDFASPAADPACEFDATGDPLWLMIDDVLTPVREHELESLFSVSNGYLGSRGALPLGVPLSAPTVFIAGIYDTTAPSALPELVAAPGWTLLSQGIGATPLATESLTLLGHRRILDMRQGIFRREFHFSDQDGHIIRIKFMRIASLADRHVLLQTSLCASDTYSGPLSIRSGFLLSPASATHTFSPSASIHATPHGPVLVLEGRTHDATGIALAVGVRFGVMGADIGADPHEAKVSCTTGKIDHVIDIDIKAGQRYRYDWLETCYTSRDVDQPAQAALAKLERLLADGVTPALRRHIDAWQRRWLAADIEIGGDPDAQRAIRFACYHLISAANPEDERVSIGARALTGPGYKGHVFWDTEIYLLPFYTLAHPASARALLMYRFHTLAAARGKAREQGFQGALYAWESAGSGEEVTPPYAITPVGEVLPVLTGMQAHHISADVAYAVWQYWQATADHEFLCSAGAEILLETARFWASRGRVEADGRYHIRQVIGPDEYHDGVDDNAYTNWMARSNLECAAAAARMLEQRWPQRWRQLAERIQIGKDEPARWTALAAAMYAGLDPKRGLIEQFQGYLALDEIDLSRYASRSLPLDVILGRERTRATQLVKQADVAMLLHLLWDRVPPPIREASFRYYEPRTEHGSSLSPAIYALLAARLGDTEMALRYFRQARDIDLANNMGNAAGGVHIAALGGLWQAAIFGFAGLSLSDRGLAFTPHCPASWRSMRFPLQWRGQKIKVHIEPALLELELADGSPIPLAVGDSPEIRLEAGWISRWELTEGGWKERGRERR